MKKLLIAIGLVILLVFPVIACAKSESPGYTQEDAAVPAPAIDSMTYEGLGGGGGDIEYTSSNSTVADSERMIVRTGDMSLIVTDVAVARDEISDLASRLGGYVVSSSISGTDDNIRGYIAIRVPDDEFDTALDELTALAVRVSSEQTNSQDVTEQYIDLQARLGNAEATEQQYLVLLDRADDVEDILRIYEKLSQIRSEIEQLKGQIQYVERTTSMSYIGISLQPEASTKPLASIWSALEVLKSAVRGLVATGQVLASIAIWLLIFIPVWGTILGIVIWRVHRRRQQKTTPSA
jgi:hypothetical protein